MKKFDFFRFMKKTSLITVLLFFLFTPLVQTAWGGATIMDTTFDGDGVVITDFSGRRDTAHDLAIQSDGKIVVVGESMVDGTHFLFTMVRYKPDGSPDHIFGQMGKIETNFGDVQNSSSARAVVIQPDQKIVVVGEGKDRESSVVRFTPSGGLDPSFGTGGIAKTPSGGDAFSSVAIQPNGKIVAGGNTDNVLEFLLARFNSDGSPDTGFGNGGEVITDFGNREYVNSLAIQSDGKIVAVGVTFTQPNIDADFAIARYCTDGKLDDGKNCGGPGFGTQGKVVTALSSFEDGALSVTIQADGKIVVAGHTGRNGRDVSNMECALVRYNSNGTIDTSFQGGKITNKATGWCHNVRIQPDGKILVGGNNVVIRYLPNGNLDNEYGIGGIVDVDFLSGGYTNSMELQSDGWIVHAGEVNYPKGDFLIIRFAGIDNCPNDPVKVEAGWCGCGNPDTDSDWDGTPDCLDQCPNDPTKQGHIGPCPCGVAEVDSDRDGLLDCRDKCVLDRDPERSRTGVCCGMPWVDADNDGTWDCEDKCPSDPNKMLPGLCGCGNPEPLTEKEKRLQKGNKWWQVKESIYDTIYPWRKKAPECPKPKPKKG